MREGEDGVGGFGVATTVSVVEVGGASWGAERGKV